MAGLRGRRGDRGRAPRPAAGRRRPRPGALRRRAARGLRQPDPRRGRCAARRALAAPPAPRDAGGDRDGPRGGPADRGGRRAGPGPGPPAPLERAGRARRPRRPGGVSAALLHQPGAARVPGQREPPRHRQAGRQPLPHLRRRPGSTSRLLRLRQHRPVAAGRHPRPRPAAQTPTWRARGGEVRGVRASTHPGERWCGERGERATPRRRRRPGSAATRRARRRRPTSRGRGRRGTARRAPSRAPRRRP